jgi:hypothetical protein
MQTPECCQPAKVDILGSRWLLNRKWFTNGTFVSAHPECLVVQLPKWLSSPAAAAAYSTNTRGTVLAALVECARLHLNWRCEVHR